MVVSRFMISIEQACLEVIKEKWAYLRCLGKKLMEK